MEDLKVKYANLKEDIKNHLSKFNNKSEREQFLEFMFCLLTPQSNAKTCWEAIEIINRENPKNIEEISKIIKGRARFHNKKSERILSATSTWKEIKKILQSNLEGIELRNEIEKKVNGYGLKEAGHFLRNIGKSDNKIAILDRHIIRELEKNGAITNTKIKGNKGYLEMEKEALEFSKKVEIPIDELDLLFWYNVHGEFFK